MRAAIVLFALALLATACRKDDLPGPNDLQVHVTLTNDITGTSVPQDLAGKVIYVTTAGDSLGYLFTAKTNENGNVVFQGLATDAYYDIYASETRENLHYQARLVGIKGDAGPRTLDLRPGTGDQNGYLLICRDVEGTPLQGLRVRTYASEAQAELNDTLQALHKGNTDIYGRYSKTDIAAGTIYARIRSADGRVDSTLSIVVAPRRISYIDLVLGVQGLTGLRLNAVNAEQEPLPQVQVCGFVLATLAQVGDCAQATFQGNTNGSGLYAVNGMLPGTYSIRVRSTVLGVDTTLTVTMVAGQITELTAVVVASTTGLRVQFTDGIGAAVPMVQICGFTSEAVAEAGDCGLANFQGSADLAGVYLRTGIAPQIYHVRVRSTALSIDTLLTYPVQSGQVTDVTAVVLP